MQDHKKILIRRLIAVVLFMTTFITGMYATDIMLMNGTDSFVIALLLMLAGMGSVIVSLTVESIGFI